MMRASTAPRKLCQKAHGGASPGTAMLKTMRMAISDQDGRKHDDY